MNILKQPGAEYYVSIFFFIILKDQGHGFLLLSRQCIHQYPAHEMAGWLENRDGK